MATAVFQKATIRRARIAVVAVHRRMFAGVVFAETIVVGTGVVIIARLHLVVSLTDTLLQALAGETVEMERVVVITTHDHQMAVGPASAGEATIDDRVNAVARQRAAVGGADVAVVAVGAIANQFSTVSARIRRVLILSSHPHGILRVSVRRTR